MERGSDVYREQNFGVKSQAVSNSRMAIVSTVDELEKSLVCLEQTFSMLDNLLEPVINRARVSVAGASPSEESSHAPIEGRLRNMIAMVTMMRYNAEAMAEGIAGR